MSSKSAKPKAHKPKSKPKSKPKATGKKTGSGKTVKRTTKTEVQSVLFDNSQYAGQQAVSWLRKHNFKAPVKPDKTANKIRYRQTSPKKYKSFATMAVPGTTGVQFVLGIK